MRLDFCVDTGIPKMGRNMSLPKDWSPNQRTGHSGTVTAAATSLVLAIACAARSRDSIDKEHRCQWCFLTAIRICLGGNVAEDFPLQPTEPLTLTVTSPWSNPHLPNEDDLLTRRARKHGNGYERECVLGQNLVGPGWVGNMRIFRERWQNSGFGMHEIFCMEHLLQWIAYIPHWRNSTEVMVLNFPL